MKFFFALCLVAALSLLQACKDTPYPIDDPVVHLQADFVQRIVGSIGVSTDTTRVDSLLVSSAKILVRRVRLHREQAGDDGYELLIGPPVVLTLPGGEEYSSVFPLGNYDGVSLELTRLTDAEAIQYASDARYAEFTVAERPSFILEGTRLKQGEWSPFRFVADTVASVIRQLDSPLGVPKGSATTVVLFLNVPQLVLFGRDIIDPLGKGNDKVLEGRVPEALRIAKKDW